MLQTLQNEFLSISVKNKGAELCSLKLLKNNKEYLWQANEKYWGKHSPILFPIIGCLKDNEYIFAGKTYKMTRHGFARENEFKLIEKGEDKLKYIFTSNGETFVKYPFKFDLYVIYTLKGSKLDITYEVKNRDNKIMYFSIGGHPAFNCNIDEGGKYVEFEQEETLDSYTKDNKRGLIEKGKKQIIKNGKKLLLTYDLFNDDTLIFDGIKSDSVYIGDDKAKDKVKLTIKGFPYLGIWTPKAPFICIEPWYGIPDTVDSNNKLQDKIGIQKLDSKGTFECSYQIEIIE